MKRVLLLLAVVGVFVMGLEPAAMGWRRKKVRLEKFDGGFFSINKPRGWKVITAGSCATFAFVARDPKEPLRQAFYFGEVGPVYMSEQQKLLDQQYMSMGGYPVTWYEMPVVAPLTPENFLKKFYSITRTQIAQSFMPQVPKIKVAHIISSTRERSFIQGGQTKLIRALFTQDGKLGEGLFTVTVAPVLPFTGSPGSGIAYCFQFIGITAPKSEFKKLENSLVKCISSFNIAQSYVNNCMRQQAQTYSGILKAGKTLSEASDIIMDGWQNRNKSDDIISEKGSDAILGKERIYDPANGEVYEFESGFYDKYNINRERYEMNNLQLLPDDNWDLWNKAPLDGSRHIR